MFNTLCFYLNFLHPRIPAVLRKAAYTVLPTRYWQYNQPTAGYKGGVDTVLGTVAFEDIEGQLIFVW